MDIGLYSWGGCLLDDVGLGGPDPYDRLYPPQRYADGYLALRESAKLADSLGYDTFWLTEHHFQREGYQIVPNVAMVAAVLAQHTQRLTFGAFFHQTPMWHPIRLAEDLAIASILSGGRIVFGTGRGSVEREMPIFGATFGHHPGDDLDAANRRLFEEQMRLIKLAWSSDEFSFAGEHYTVPVPGYLNTGHPETGRPWDQVTLVPRPTEPIPIYQAAISATTRHYAAAEGHRAVIPLVRQFPAAWRHFGELVEQHQGRPVSPADRVALVQAYVGDTRAEAIERFRPYHDERYRFLAAQHPIYGYTEADGTPFAFGRAPTLEESIDQGNFFVGTTAEVRDELAGLVAEHGIGHLVAEITFAGMTPAESAEQVTAFATEVRPALEQAAALAA